MRVDFYTGTDRHTMSFPQGATVQAILDWIRRVYDTPATHTFLVIMVKFGAEDTAVEPDHPLKVFDRESYHFIELMPITVINKGRQPAPGDSGEDTLKLTVRVGTTTSQLMERLRYEYPSEMDGRVIWRLISDRAELLPKAEIVSGGNYKRIFSCLSA